MTFDICTYVRLTLSYLEERLGRQARPEVLAVTAYAVYSLWFGPWGAVSLVCLCGLCVSGARLLESVVLQELMRRYGQPSVGGGTAQKYAYYTALTLLALLLVQVLVSPATPWLLASRWYLLLVTPLLGAALHFIGSPRAELSEALAGSQTNYAQGAAWGFFLGYLMINFGHGYGTMGEEEVPSFAQRMSDYLTSNEVGEEDRRRTCENRMIILVPMKHEALLSDKNFSENDKSVTKEQKLQGITHGGRQFGQMQVYTIKHEDGHSYRVAMEEATPIRTAALAVDDSAAEDFILEDFEEFARRFKTELQRILRSKPGIRDQVELVPIEDMKKVGSTVVQRILELKRLEEGSGDQRQELAERLTAAGSVAAGQPEQQGVPT